MLPVPWPYSLLPLEHLIDVRRVVQPVAGVDWTVTVPGGVIWQPVTVRAQLAAAAGGGGRNPRLILDDGTTEFWRLGTNVNVAGGVTNVISWGHHMYSISGGSTISGILPQCVLLPGFRLGVSTDGLAAGDQWSAIVLYLVTYSQTPPVEALAARADYFARYGLTPMLDRMEAR